MLADDAESGRRDLHFRLTLLSIMLEVQESPTLAPRGPEDIESGMPAIPEGQNEGASPSSTDGLTANPQNPGTPRTPTQWKGGYRPKRGAPKPTGPKYVHNAALHH